MRQKYLIGAALLVGFFVIGGEWYLLARPIPRDENPMSSPVHTPPAQSILTPSPTPAVAKPAATITPTVGTPSVTPSLITVNTPTTVTVTVQISPTPIANGVNLLRLGATGTQPTILGVMHDDGQNGDAVANDGVYTLQITLNETTVSQIQIEVSAAFQGLLKRVVSSISILPVWGSFTDPITSVTVTFPPIGTQTQLVASSPTNGALSDLDLQVFDSSSNSFIAVAGMAIYANPNKLSLPQWFESNVDENSILQSNNTFRSTTLPNGVAALVLFQPVPAAFLAVSGPVAQIYAILPPNDDIISLTQAQEAQVSDYGYDTNTLFLEILGMMQFP